MAVRRVARKPVFPPAAAADCFSKRFQGSANGRESRTYDRLQTRDSAAFPGLPDAALPLPDTAVSCAGSRGRRGRGAAGAHAKLA